MGRRGPAKQPDVLAKLQGKPASGNVVATGDLPDPPEYLSDGGLKIWWYMEKNAPRGLLASVDAVSFSAYCEAAAEFAELVEWCQENDCVVFSEKGGCYQHPNVGRKNKAAERLLRFGDRFGFTPASRASIGAAISEKAGNAFAEWKEQRQARA